MLWFPIVWSLWCYRLGWLDVKNKTSYLLTPYCVITLVLLYWLTGFEKTQVPYSPLCDFSPTPHCVTFFPPPWQLEGAQRAACWPAVCRRTARSGCCCWRQAEMTEVCPSSLCPWRAWTSDVLSTTGTIQQCHKSTHSKAWRGRYCVFMLLVVYLYL